MTPVRCPSCHAALAPAAQWCTLCFADLRPAPPEPEAATPAELVTAGPAGLPEPPAPPRPAPLLAPHPILDAPRAPKHALRPEDERPILTQADLDLGVPGWPCVTCGGVVPLALTECPACGSGFLATAKETPKVSLPGIGNIAELTTGARVALMIGGATLVTVLFFVVLLVIGSIF